MAMRVSVKAILTHKGKFLLLKPVNGLNSVNGWDVPGGTVNKEESLEQALQRELKEETGIELKKYKFLTPMFSVDNETRFEIFIGRTNTDKVILSREHTSYCWVDKSEFQKLTGVSLNFME